MLFIKNQIKIKVTYEFSTLSIHVFSSVYWVCPGKVLIARGGGGGAIGVASVRSC